MSKSDEELAARLVSRETGIELEPTKLKLDGWGEADCACQLANGSCLVLEAERGQKHPTTNVAKLWPWLEKDEQRSIALVHVFFEPNAAPLSRRQLTQWLGQRMARELVGRFRYLPLTIEGGVITRGLPDLRDWLASLSSTHASPPALGPRFQAAISLAAYLHRGDTRKGKRTPYVAHLLGVCDLVLQDGGSEDEAIAALLHDTLEDHPEDISPEELRSRFGDGVLAIVRSCSDTPEDYAGGQKPPWRERKTAYLEHLTRATEGARRVSLADKFYNAKELLADLKREGPSTWKRFNAGRDDQLWYYRAILERMRGAGQTGALMERFELVVDELRRAAGDDADGPRTAARQ
jgi:hypothetical protein